MAAIRVDENRWPVVIADFSGEQTDDQLASYLRHIKRYLDARKRFALIVDLRQATRTPLSQQAQIAEWLKSNVNSFRKLNVATAFVFSSPVFRFVLSRVFLIQPMPSPHLVTADFEEAVTWAWVQITKGHLVD
jgi:hypothetical protein